MPGPSEVRFVLPVSALLFGLVPATARYYCCDLGNNPVVGGRSGSTIGRGPAVGGCEALGRTLFPVAM